MEIAAHALVPDAHHTLPSNLPPSGTAGGDLSGSYPDPTVEDDSHDHGDTTISDDISINNTRLFAPAGAGNVGIGTLAPATELDVEGTITGDGLTIDGPVAGTGFSAFDTDASDDITTATSAGGDLSGTYANLTVKDDSHGHQDGSISNTLTITGGLVSDAVLSANVTKQGVITTLPPSGQAGGDLSGEYPSPTVKDDSHGHIDGSISDTLTITGGSVADSVLSANVTKRGQFIDVDELGFDPATQSELVNHQGNVIAHHPLKRPAVLPPMTTVTTFSAVNSNSPKFVLVECPFGTRVTGGGYTVFNIAPRIMVTRNSGENRFWHIKAEEVVNEPGDWSVSGFAICMSPHAH